MAAASARVSCCVALGGLLQTSELRQGLRAPLLQDQRRCSCSASTSGHLRGWSSSGWDKTSFINRDRHACKAMSPNQTASTTAELEALGVTETGKFSISDAELLSQGFELHRSLENIDLDDLNSLFVKVGFPRRQNKKLLRALEHTGSMLWITKSEKIVAFARATGDNVFNAIIWDVVVDPSYQGIGVGKAVMERLMADLCRKGISNIVLYAEPNVLGFYKPLGFVVDPDGIRAMSLTRKRRT